MIGLLWTHGIVVRECGGSQKSHFILEGLFCLMGQKSPRGVPGGQEGPRNPRPFPQNSLESHPGSCTQDFVGYNLVTSRTPVSQPRPEEIPAATCSPVISVNPFYLWLPFLST